MICLFSSISIIFNKLFSRAISIAANVHTALAALMGLARFAAYPAVLQQRILQARVMVKLQPIPV